MSRIADLSKLFHAISARNWGEAQVWATKLAEAEEAKGHHSAANRLRGALKPNGSRGQESSVVSGEASHATGILTPVALAESLKDVALRDETRRELNGLVVEWHQRSRLAAHGVRRRNKILLYGPPGCGKSLTARAIARDVGLPAYLVRLDAVVGAFLGQTALRVREIFRFAETVPCVLLLDEIDALGRERGTGLDVGELDRVVISVMQQLEHSEPMGYLVATSNLAARLDPALRRRFDLTLGFPAPSKPERAKFAQSRARANRVPLRGALRSRVLEMSAYADIEKAITDEKRRILLARS